MPGLLQKVLMTLTFYVSIFSWQQIIYIFRPQCKCCLCDQNFSMIYMFRKPLYAVSYPTLLKLIKQVIIEKIRTSWGTCEGIKKKKKKKWTDSRGKTVCIFFYAMTSRVQPISVDHCLIFIFISLQAPPFIAYTILKVLHHLSVLGTDILYTLLNT